MAAGSSADSRIGACCETGVAGFPAGSAGRDFFTFGSAAFTSSTTTLEITVGIRHNVDNWSDDFSLATSNSRRWVLAGEPASGRAPKTSVHGASPFRTSCRAAIGMAQCGSIPVVMWYTCLPRDTAFWIASFSYSVQAAGATAALAVFFEPFFPAPAPAPLLLPL